MNLRLQLLCLLALIISVGDLRAQDEVTKALETAYGQASFVRLRGPGVSPDTKHVTGTNYLDIGWHHDPRTGRLILQSTEDNLGKGAAGQAVQSFNLMAGYTETDGLRSL